MFSQLSENFKGINKINVHHFLHKNFSITLQRAKDIARWKKGKPKLIKFLEVNFSFFASRKSTKTSHFQNKKIIALKLSSNSSRQNFLSFSLFPLFPKNPLFESLVFTLDFFLRFPQRVVDELPQNLGYLRELKSPKAIKNPSKEGTKTRSFLLTKRSKSTQTAASVSQGKFGLRSLQSKLLTKMLRRRKAKKKTKD